MPRLVRMYIVQSLLGVGVATVFVAGLFAFNVGNLWYLVTNTEVGPFAAFLLWAHFAVLCGGVQFAIRIMRMGEEDEDHAHPGGGASDHARISARVRIAATSVPKVGRRRGSSGRDSA